MSQKINSDYAHLLSQVVELENESALSTKDLWLKMAEALEIEGFEKEKIWAKVASDIEDSLWDKYNKETPRDEFKWSRSGYFGRAGKKAGYVLNSNNDEIALGQPDNSSIYTKNDKMLTLCERIIDMCHTIKEKSQDCEELETIFEKKEMEEFYFQQNAFLDNCKNAIDSKTKIPENTETMLLDCLATVMGNVNTCGKIFQEVILMHMKEQCKFLTAKQSNKFQNGGKQSRLYLLHPTERDFAIFEKYTGTRCTKCQSFRVRPTADHTNKWECYDCGEILQRQHIPKCPTCQVPLFKERLIQIVKTGICKNCEEPVELPQTLIDQANS